VSSAEKREKGRACCRLGKVEFRRKLPKSTRNGRMTGPQFKGSALACLKRRGREGFEGWKFFKREGGKEKSFKKNRKWGVSTDGLSLRKREVTSKSVKWKGRRGRSSEYGNGFKQESVSCFLRVRGVPPSSAKKGAESV